MIAVHDGIATVYNDGGWHGGYGRYISIAGDDGIETRYAHLSQVFVSTGPVRAGQLIGAVGGRAGGNAQSNPAEGDSTSEHLHFEIRKNGNLVTPISGATTTATASVALQSEIYKGFFKAKPDQTLSDQLVSVGPQIAGHSPASAFVAAARPGEELFANLKGFDWDESVLVRVTDATGVALPSVYSQRLVGTGLLTDDISEQPIADLNPGPVFSTSGLYFVEGVEQNRPLASGTIGGGSSLTGGGVLPWSQSLWATPSPAADAAPLAVVVSKSAPPAGVDTDIASLRTAGRGYTIRTSNGDPILIVTGTSGADTIALSKSGANWLLTIGATTEQIPSEFSAVYVDAGAGNDVVDLRQLPATIGSTVRGGDGVDVIYGGHGQDILIGGADGDVLVGGDGEDWLFGGAGSDDLTGDTQGTSGTAFIDHVFGESGDDRLNVASVDQYSGGTGTDRVSLTPGPTSGVVRLANGGALLFGNQSTATADQFVAKARADGSYTFSNAVGTATFAGGVFDVRDGSVSRILVVGGAGSETFDFRDSPVSVTILGGGGNDVAYGTAFSDTLIGGAGNDTLYGYGGADTLVAAGGINVLDAGPGDDSINASGNGDTVHGGTGVDYVFGSTLDTFVDQEATDHAFGLAAHVSNRLQSRLEPTLVATANLVSTDPIGTEVIVTNGNSPFSLVLNDPTVTQGDSALVTITTTDIPAWGRLQIYADLNADNRFTADTDLLLTQVRGRDQNWRGQVRTDKLTPGVYTIRARLLTFDGGDLNGGADTEATLTVLAPPAPPTLPSHLDIAAGDAKLIVPFDDGDALIPNNEIVGQQQFSMFQMSVGTSGNHAFSTTGMSTILGLYDASGDMIGSQVLSGELQSSLTAGATYYVVVAGATAAPGTFNLVITGRNQVIDGSIDTPPGNYLGTGSGQFTPENRIDYWRLVAPMTANFLKVSVTAPEDLKLWVRITDDDNNLVALADFSASDRSIDLSSGDIVPGKTYNITVCALGGTEGSYMVQADFDSDDVGLPATIVQTVAQANYQPLIIQANGDYELPNQQINSSGQFRYFLITPTSSGEFVINTTGSTDMLLGVYSGNGQQLLAQSDNDLDGVNGRVELALTGGEPYWVVARGSGANGGGFGIEVAGPDQLSRPINIGGLGLQGSEQFFLGITSNRQQYYQFTVPAGVDSAAIRVEQVNTAQPLILWWSIQDSQGVTHVYNSNGVTGPVTANLDWIQAGETYFLTITSTDRSPGSAKISIDLSPDASTSAEFVVNTSTFNAQDQPRIATNSSGRTVVVWTRDAAQNSAELDDDIYFQIFDETGHAVGSEQRANATDGYVNQSSADVGIAADGSFWLTWRDPVDENNSSLSRTVIRRFNATGAPLTSEINVGFAGPSTSRIAVQPDGNCAVFCAETSRRAVIRTFSPNGSATSPVRIIDAPPSNTVIHPSIAIQINGGYVVGWSRQTVKYNLILQRVDSTGNKLGSEIAIGPSNRDQFASSLGANATGQFTVVYQQNDIDGTGDNVYAQRFAADGSALNAAVRVNAFTSGSQTNPVVRMKDDGS
ncbi:MAG: peptidoglycan DD-metalloendopeptidase family protein, partial [Planctomycetota bacterium]|nr:peptidoglycan DD-metalloendopeptidase family protein [Planctomycetota bacterium]